MWISKKQYDEETMYMKNRLDEALRAKKDAESEAYATEQAATKTLRLYGVEATDKFFELKRQMTTRVVLH